MKFLLSNTLEVIAFCVLGALCAHWAALGLDAPATSAASKWGSMELTQVSAAERTTVAFADRTAVAKGEAIESKDQLAQTELAQTELAQTGALVAAITTTARVLAAR